MCAAKPSITYEYHEFDLSCGDRKCFHRNLKGIEQGLDPEESVISLPISMAQKAAWIRQAAEDSAYLYYPMGVPLSLTCVRTALHAIQNAAAKA
jgi:hypothetical protein